ncbi:PepSY domain-containing protein [Aerococcaceae bacterium NML191292]|nr:PepSY domain-containing protein [Aerococcaceae bacterium NML191292]MCW6661386.1 PepSY domain-containing protein [Aerococcaceae bacterium NML201209]MCW6680815.1 PepSY domain-containing protein [Aerococcaceae bacterium NML130460]MCW6682165.1 PepSY domain-containing protein [Aerococcaceae bacterium NML160702]
MNRKTVSILTFICLLILLCFTWLFWQSQTKISQAESEAVKLVEYDYPVKSVKRFYWVTIDQTYFSLFFEDKDGQERYAIIARDGGKAQYYTPNDIISEEDAISIAKGDVNPHKILQARLGIMDDKPVWEVTFKNANGTLTYYYLNATNGEWIEKIENI